MIIVHIVIPTVMSMVVNTNITSTPGERRFHLGGIDCTIGAIEYFNTHMRSSLQCRPTTLNVGL
jgi:hypothetical protein